MAKRAQYLTDSQNISDELKRLMFEETEWTLKKDSKSAKIYCLPAPKDTYIWKAETTIPIKPEKIIDMVLPTEKYRFMWDPNITSCVLLEELDHDTIIAHTTMKAKLLGLLSARDVIDVFKIEETDQYYSSQFGSIEYENAPPPKPDVIRAWSYPSGIFIFKNNENKNGETRVVIFYQADGRLDVVPPAMLNAAMPTFMKNYFKALRKTGDIPWTPLVDVAGRRKA